MVICTFTAARKPALCSRYTPLTPPVRPTSRLLLYLHLLSIFLSAHSTLSPVSSQLVFFSFLFFKRRQRWGGKFSPSSHQLAIMPEKLPNESTADERKKWDKLLFINTQRGERFAYVGIVCVWACVCACVCVYCSVCVFQLFLRGFKQAGKSFHLHIRQTTKYFSSLANALIEYIWLLKS